MIHDKSKGVYLDFLLDICHVSHMYHVTSITACHFSNLQKIFEDILRSMKKLYFEVILRSMKKAPETSGKGGKH